MRRHAYHRSESTRESRMPLTFTKPNRIALKSHPEFSEKWVQDRIIEDPSLLGLGELDLVTAEKIQPKAGRLDLLLHDEQLNRRYEIELMLGATDASHIVRCIEYWDIERRRYPAYEHVAVLVAEDITSRFLNVLSLLAGNIPFIALQLVALQVDDKIVVHFVQVLDHTSLRSDDTYELGNSSAGVSTDRDYWEKRASTQTMQCCDSLLEIMQQITGRDYTLRYRKRIIDVTASGDTQARIWIIPRKTLVRIGGYVSDPEAWVKRFDDLGQNASLRRGNKAALVSFKPSELVSQEGLLREFLADASGGDESSDAANEE